MNKLSLKHCKTKWLPEIQMNCPNIPIILVCCKSDMRFVYKDKHFIQMCQKNKYNKFKKLKQSDFVTPAEGRAMAQEIGAAAYYETSVLTGYGVNTVFDNAIRAALIHRRKSTFWITGLRNVKSPEYQEPYCPPQPIMSDMKHADSTYWDDLLKVLKMGESADVKIYASCIEFCAHSTILAAASTYFRSLLAKNITPVYEVTDFQWMNPITMDFLLQFLYGANYQKLSGVDDSELLRAAKIAKLSELEECIINAQNGLEIYNYAIHKKRICKLKMKMRNYSFVRNIGADVTFELDDGKCAANRSILTARCDMMAAMFKSGFKEHNAKNVTFPGISRECFLQLLVYLYTDKLDLTVSITNYMELLELANKLCLVHLVSLIEHFAVQCLSDADKTAAEVQEHVVTSLELAKVHNAFELYKFFQYYACINYADISSSFPKLLQCLQPENQVYLKSNRWPPAIYISEKKYYEEHMFLLYVNENNPQGFTGRLRRFFSSLRKRRGRTGEDGSDESNNLNQ